MKQPFRYLPESKNKKCGILSADYQSANVNSLGSSNSKQLRVDSALHKCFEQSFLWLNNKSRLKVFHVANK